MIFTIANLELDENSFSIPASLGNWEFIKTPNYDEHLPHLAQGMCANTFFASNDAISARSRDAEFEQACDEIIDICLVLSFLNGRCVTPTGTAAGSEISFVTLGDDFIVARSIVGFPKFLTNSVGAMLQNWSSTMHSDFNRRQLRLQLSHWLSGLTCFSMEDLFLSVGVQMDIVKQRECSVTGNRLTYFDGMISASNRFSITPLGRDYKNMRNDIVHEGRLSGTNFSGKSKQQCADLTAETLNWLDRYVTSVLNITSHIQNLPRWNGADISNGLPSHTVR